MALAVSDVRGKFLSFSVGHSGSTHDSLAWETSGLGKKVAAGALPDPYFIIGDDAFANTDQLLVPWPGRGIGKWKDSFNYWLSHSRQCVERAFGMLVRR